MRLLLSLALALALAAACDAPIEEPTQQPPAVSIDKANLTLYVSNQSFEIDPVDIQVEIDGKLAVSGDFLVEGQHSWHQFPFALSPGEHELRMSSSAGPTRTEAIVIDDPRYAVINFWFYPEEHYEPYGPEISLDLFDEPPVFQ
jgi:hypothetical protein